MAAMAEGGIEGLPEFECDANDGADGADGADDDEMRAALGGVASGLAEQLTTITQEMNKIREELYGDNGIGGIAQELEKLKSGSLNGMGGLGGLLEDPDLAGMGDMGDMGEAAKQFAHPSAEGSEGREWREGLRSRPKASNGAGMQGRPPPLDKERKLEELRRKIERRHLMEEKKSKDKEKAGFLEWLVIIFVIFMMVYTASSSFRSQVKQFFGEVVFGEASEDSDFGALVEEDPDSYF